MEARGRGAPGGYPAQGDGSGMEGEAGDDDRLRDSKQPVLADEQVCRIYDGSQKIYRRCYMEKNLAHFCVILRKRVLGVPSYRSFIFIPRLERAYPLPSLALKASFIPRTSPARMRPGRGEPTKSLIILSFLSRLRPFFNSFFLTAPSISTSVSYSVPMIFSSSSRSLCARRGLFPEVDIATVKDPLSTTEGMMKLQWAGSSTTFTGSPRASASIQTAAVTSFESVAAMARKKPLSMPGLNRSL